MCAVLAIGCLQVVDRWVASSFKAFLDPSIDKFGAHLCYFFANLTKGKTSALGVAFARRTERNIAAFVLKPVNVSRTIASLS